MIVSKREKGFTLVELLIVIVVIGVLSTMMMLSSTEAVTSAKAATIISNLRNWKTATLAWYMDNLDRVNDKGQVKKDNTFTNFAESGVTMEIAKYINSEFKADGNDGRFVKDSSNGRYYVDHNTISGSDKFRWFIGYEMPTNDKRLQEKLESRAQSVGLYSKYYSAGLEGQYTASSHTPRCICIEVIDFSK